MWSSSYALLLVSAVVISPLGMAEYTRFAATEIASAKDTAKVVAMILTYGAILSSVGPLIAAFFGEIVDPNDPSRSYAWDMLFCLTMTCLVLVACFSLKMPGPTKLQVPDVKSWYNILVTRAVLIAAFAQWTVMFCMLLPMIAIVLQMQAALNLDQNANIETSAVITVHVLGMFATGILTRHILPKIGFFYTILLGLSVQSIGNILFIAVPENELWVYFVGNFFVGAGWNFAHVAGR